MVARTQRLNVFMNGELVGVLTRNRSGVLDFQYDKDWINSSVGRPVSLSLPLRREAFSGNVVQNYFQNLLPDSTAILTRIANEFSILGTNPFDYLAAIGKDCVGALQFFRDDETPHLSNAVNAVAVTDKEIAERLSLYQSKPLGMDVDEDFRISLAGAQEKTAFLRMKNAWYLPVQATPTTHIFKLPIGVLQGNTLDLSDSCENEWLCLKLAKFFGLEAAEADICRFDDKKVLAVRRFDRRWSKDGTKLFRLPTEDLCQALSANPINKYESDGGPGISAICSLLNHSITPQKDKEAFLAAQVFLWLIDSTDGHAKNYSVFILPQGAFCLTPFYDILSAAPLVKDNSLSVHKIKLAMAVSGKTKHYRIAEILPRHFVETAEQCGVSHARMDKIFRHFIERGDRLRSELLERLPSDFPSNTSEPILDAIQVKLKLIESYLND